MAEMKIRPKYKVIIEDESRLATLAAHSASALKWGLYALLALMISIVLGVMIVAFSPVRSFLPGYLKESERAESQLRLLHLDSLQKAYEINALFLDNIASVLNPSSSHPDTVRAVLVSPFAPDSIIPTSTEENRFASLMNEREKFNISVIAPLAAESLMFGTLSDEAVISGASSDSYRAEYILAKGSPVSAIADGKVIAVSQSIRDAGSAIIIQHPKGFLSRCSRLGSVLVEPGDDVAGGQIIALSGIGNAKRSDKIVLELWHNGESLVPYKYIGHSESHASISPSKHRDQVL